MWIGGGKDRRRGQFEKHVSQLTTMLTWTSQGVVEFYLKSTT